jgi:hypothetical protein
MARQPACCHGYCIPRRTGSGSRHAARYLAEAGLGDGDRRSCGPQAQRLAGRVHQALRGRQVQNDAAGGVQGVHHSIAGAAALEQ